MIKSQTKYFTNLWLDIRDDLTIIVEEIYKDQIKIEINQTIPRTRKEYIDFFENIIIKLKHFNL